MRCPAELRELLIDLVDGELAGEDRARLAGMLRDDAEARRYYLEFIQLHARLELSRQAAPLTPPREFLLPAVVQEIEDAADPAADKTLAPQRPLAPVRQSLAWPTPGMVSVMLAVCIISLGLLILARISLPQPRDNPRLAGAAPPAAPIAHLTQAVDCVWKNEPPQLGEGIRPGTVLHLESGLARLRFAGGATVVLQGDSIFEVASASLGRLETGRLTARAPSDAIGFSILTPVASVVDLGTEFAVGHTAQSGTETHVIEGVVALRPRERAGKTASEAVLLTRGQSVRLRAAAADATAQFEWIPHDTSAFTRQVPTVFRVVANSQAGLLRSDGRREPGGNDSGLRRIGSSNDETTGLAVVYMFRLPALDDAQQISQVRLNFTCTSLDGEPAFDVDLYGLGRCAQPDLQPGWFYEGPHDRSRRADYNLGADDRPVVRIAPGILSPESQPGEIVVENDELLQFIRSLYKENPREEKLAVFRLNATQPTTNMPKVEGYNVVLARSSMGNLSSEDFPVLSVHIDSPPDQGARSE